MRRLGLLAVLLVPVAGASSHPSAIATKSARVASDPSNMSARGQITQIDGASRRLMIRTDDNREMVIHAAMTTEIRLNDRPTSLGSLRSGDYVTVVNPRDTGAAQMILARRPS